MCFNDEYVIDGLLFILLFDLSMFGFVEDIKEDEIKMLLFNE